MIWFPSLTSAYGIASYALLLFLCYVVVGGTVNYLKLRQFNGPPLAAFSRIWIFWHAVNARLNTASAEVFKKYGPVCRLGPNLIMTTDPDILRHISASRSKWEKSSWYDAMQFDPRSHNVFSMRDEKAHTALRAQVATGYQGRDQDGLEPAIDLRTIEFIDFIKRNYEGKQMDFSLTSRYYIVDILSTIAFGKPFGFMAANEDLWDFTKQVDQFVAMVELSANHEFIRRITLSSFMQKLVGPKETDKLGLGPALGFSRKLVAERFGPNPVVKEDFLGHFVSKGLSQMQCEVEAFTILVGGSDSTSTVLRCAMFQLAASPAAYRKLQSEIDEAFDSGKASIPVIQYSEARELSYLRACIWECFRMFPPLVGLISKVAPPEGDTIKGIFFPGGTEIGGYADAFCRLPEVFGEDADIYRPERWLEVKPDARIKLERHVDLIFGFGKYMCLGKHIATVELYKSIAMLLRHFDWSIVDPIRGADSHNHIAYVHHGMNMVARSR